MLAGEKTERFQFLEKRKTGGEFRGETRRGAQGWKKKRLGGRLNLKSQQKGVSTITFIGVGNCSKGKKRGGLEGTPIIGPV